MNLASIDRVKQLDSWHFRRLAKVENQKQGYRSGFVDESASPTGKQIDLPIESHVFIFNSAPLGKLCDS